MNNKSDPHANKATSMRVGINELKEMVGNAIKSQLDEHSIIQEGPSEISTKLVLDEMKDVIVSSITEDLTRELPNKEEAFIAKVVSSGYDAMTREILRNIDNIGVGMHNSGPVVQKRRAVVFNPLNSPVGKK